MEVVLEGVYIVDATHPRALSEIGSALCCLPNVNLDICPPCKDKEIVGYMVEFRSSSSRAEDVRNVLDSVWMCETEGVLERWVELRIESDVCKRQE